MRQILDAAKIILEVMGKDNNLINLNESPLGSVPEDVLIFQFKTALLGKILNL